MTTELLAPVGGREQLEAAVRCGANAVYFGATGFNARRNAENFSGNDFISAVRFCHERGVKAYITLNTLITDAEAAALYDCADEFWPVGDCVKPATISDANLTAMSAAQNIGRV